MAIGWTCPAIAIVLEAGPHLSDAATAFGN